MTDIWSFLLQTLTTSGVAALLLAIKAMFRDKLPPRWHFAVWGLLALVLLLPAGRGGRYVLLNWPMAVEWIKSVVTGEFGTLTHVIAPVPLPAFSMPKSAEDWLYLFYLAGVVFLLGRYFVSYICLRRALKRGRPGQNEQVRAVAERYHLSACPAVEVDGLSTAFICGLFKPVLALPAGAETDEKVILHELLHLKHKDVAWGLVICFFRCIHWCNPLLWMCADQAGNDLESLCDQRVLERLEGEDRRDYGRILLSMADEKYARAPGTSSAANGGQNIRRRIEAIARFKRYPAGMALVSVCVALVLAFPLVIGVQADTISDWRRDGPMIMSSARITYCTTYAGAFDAYAKAVMERSIPYRAMCAPLSKQNELAEEFGTNGNEWSYVFGAGYFPWITPGYSIYNLTPVGKDAWEGVLVLTLDAAPEGEAWSGLVSERWLAMQKLRAEKEGERWVILPQEEFRVVQGDQRMSGNLAVPAWVYEAQYGDFTIRTQWQTVASVDNYIAGGDGVWSSPTYNTVPVPDAEFNQVEGCYMVYALYNGDRDKRDEYSNIRVSYVPVYGESADPQRHNPTGVGGVALEKTWKERDLREYWNEVQDKWEIIFLSGGGQGYEGPEAETYQFPSAYEVELYLNGEFTAKLELLPTEGGTWIEH